MTGGFSEGYIIKNSKIVTFATLAFAPFFCFGQQIALNSAPADLTSTSSVATSASVTDALVATEATVASVAPPAPSTPTSLTGRWLDLTELSHSERFRNSYNSGNIHNFDAGQQRNLVIAKIKLDPNGRYFIGVRASSGRYFNWAYAEFAGPSRTDLVARATANGSSAAGKTAAQIKEQALSKIADPAGALIPGTFTNGWEFYVRELYLSATPVKAVTVEFGSFGFERGYASEITTYDMDGYLTGERVSIQAPKHLFFDQVGFTTGFVGFINVPNLFKRGAGFQSSNYRQVFAKKQLTKRIGFSEDYTWDVGANTLRQAAFVDTKEAKFVDSVRVETYERLNAATLQGLSIKGGYGFAITADKQITKRVNFDAGFASIDEDNAVNSGSRYLHATGYSINGDTYGLGNRPFTHASVKIAPGVTAFGYYTHAVGWEVPARALNLNKQGLNAGVTFDFKAMANLEKKIF